jgi:hypothetical protein
MADGIRVAEHVDGLAAVAHPVGLQQLAPFVERAACLLGHLPEVGHVS